MKGAAFITLALFIDGLQAGLVAALSIVAAIPGTVLGGAVGCYVGGNIFGEWGCAAGGFILGLLGTTLDGLAVVTEPIGLMMGFAIDVCITCTFGMLLVGLLIFNKMYYPKFIFGGGIVELLPGFNLLPSWTAMTVLCVLRAKKAEGGVLGAAAGVATATGASQLAAARGATQGAAETRRVDGIRSPEPQTNAA